MDRNRKGRFWIRGRYFDDMQSEFWENIKKVFAETIITDVQSAQGIDRYYDATEYTAYCELFDPCNWGSEPLPRYEIVFDDSERGFRMDRVTEE